MGRYKRSVLIGSLGASAFSFALVSPVVFGAGTSGNVQLDTEIATSIAMKIVSPNDVDPNCTPEAGVTYGVVNRYASSTGDDSGKMVDTFNGNEGEADEINTNTSCATLSMTPNTFDSTYSDVTVYTNSGTGYAVTLQSAENVSPNLVNVADNTQYIEAGALTEQDGTGEQAGQKVVPGGQNKWAYKTNNGIITDWTAATTSPVAIRSYDTTTSGGDTTRVTYGISAGNTPTGKYTTTLTYTATMFDGPNPYVSKLNIPTVSNLSISSDSLSIPFGQSETITVTPAEGYYLSSVTCPEGFTCTGYNTGMDYTGAQTITVKNGNTNNTGIIGFSTTLADPWVAAGCDSATKDSPCTVSGVQYIKLADGHYWTKELQGTATWSDFVNNYSCPSGTNKPSADTYYTLISKYGGVPEPSMGSPYGIRATSTALWETTNWPHTHYWSTTELSSGSSTAYNFELPGSREAWLHASEWWGTATKTAELGVLCYR